MITNERDSRSERVAEAARRMLTAARTAPKARGVDILECCVVEGDDIKRLSDAMLELFAETGRPVFQRDAANILKADAVVVIATRPHPIGLDCGHCGSPTCAEKPAGVPCVFNILQNIAGGSSDNHAVSFFCRLFDDALFLQKKLVRKGQVLIAGQSAQRGFGQV